MTVPGVLETAACGRQRNPFMQRPGIRLLMVLIVLLAAPACEREADDYRATTFLRLEKARNAKKEILIAELQRLWVTVARAADDEALREAFRSLNPNAASSLAASQDRDMTVRSLLLDQHYVSRYGKFYDILFIDPTGFVFHSIKMESDYRQNLFGGPLADTRLARALKERDGSTVRFVDYDYYHPSREAASFFVAAMADGGRPVGWVVFQFSINTINELLDEPAGLGVTGEVYLTNSEKMMISQSRLLPEDTVLRLKVDTEALRTALEKRSGALIGHDYRNVSVFSSFERFSFGGSDWIIVAEIDEDEVITEHFTPRLEQELPRLAGLLTSGSGRRPESVPSSAAPLRVDINEYAKIARRDSAITFGVATCTAVVIRHPERFAYLGHVYPLDMVYRSSLERGLHAVGIDFLGRRTSGRSDLLGRMLRSLKYYDIHAYEVRDLDVVVAAVHHESLIPVVRTLVAEGFFLSQIRVLTLPGGRYANVSVESGSANIAIEWMERNGTPSWSGLRRPPDAEAPDLGSLLKRLSSET